MQNVTFLSFHKKVSEIKEKVGDYDVAKLAAINYFGFSKVKVIYADNSSQVFDFLHWLNIRENILKNLVEKNLATLKFIT